MLAERKQVSDFEQFLEEIDLNVSSYVNFDTSREIPSMKSPTIMN